MDIINKGKATVTWIIFILKYWIALISVFQVSRIVFFVFNFNEAKTMGLQQVLLSAWFGLTMDISMATYVLVPVMLFLVLAIFLKLIRKTLILKIYTGIILFLILFLLIVDMAMYKTWGFRLDATPLKYISHPREAWASLQHQPLGWILFFLLLGTILIIKMNNAFISKGFKKIDTAAPTLLTFFSLLILLGLSIVPIRGGFQLAPINQSSVYFSSNHFANQSALNGPWNLFYSLTRSVNEEENPYTLLPKHESDALVEILFRKNGVNEKWVTIDSMAKPNVMLIIWEGLTAKAIDLNYDGEAITPNFNALKKDGVYFSNLYASGDRTDKGLVAVLSGYPANPQESILKVPLKASKLPMLSREFQKRGYHTTFYYGGETEFANMKAYLLQGGFEQIISIDNFEKKDRNSKWGAHDEVVMNKINEDIAHYRQPFFCTWLTLSSHEPFEVPTTPVFKVKDEVGQYLNSLHYTDSVFGVFIQKLKTSSLWENTIVVTIADHGSRMPKASFKADDFKIGALLLGGLIKEPKVIKGIGSQVDMAGMLLKELGFGDKVFPWSKDLRDTTGVQWSFFSFNNGFGYTEPLGSVIYDNVGKRIIQQSGNVGELQIRRGKALQQAIYQDYLNK